MRSGMSRAVVIGCHMLVVLLCLGASAAAETQFGVIAGLNWTKLDGDRPDKAAYNRAMGYGVGLVGDVGLSKDVVLSIQPMYVRRGTDISFDVGEDERRDSLEVRLDYIDCLIMVKVFADNDVTYFSSGLGFGFLTNAKLTDIRSGEEGVKDEFQNFDLSLAMGVGFMIPVKRSVVTLELRYQQSLLNISDSDAELQDNGLSPRMRSSGFQILAAVLFPRRE